MITASNHDIFFTKCPPKYQYLFQSLNPVLSELKASCQSTAFGWHVSFFANCSKVYNRLFLLLVITKCSHNIFNTMSISLEVTQIKHKQSCDAELKFFFHSSFHWRTCFERLLVSISSKNDWLTKRLQS